jgi:predicted Fe-S protein YdhL (DUF1289 family)
MSSYINHFKKTAEQNAKDLQDIPKNWESMQDADQDEIAQLNKQEYLEEQKELEENNPTQSELLRDVGMSHSDFI